MTELERARKNLYKVIESGDQNEILKASKILDRLIVRYMNKGKNA